MRMQQTMYRFLLASFFVFILSSQTNAEEPAHAAKPSFDCNEAQTPAEKAICSSSELSAQDILLNKVYKQASSNSYGDDLERLWNDQFNFLTERNKCLNDAPCIKNATEVRIQELENFSKITPEEPSEDEGDGRDVFDAFWSNYSKTYDEEADAEAYVTGCTTSGSEFSRLRDKFGDWRVRHVYDEETLQHRFSDAKTDLILEGGSRLRAQISRASDGNASFRFVYGYGRWEDIGVFSGWVTRIEVEIDGQKYGYEMSFKGTHEFIANVDSRFLDALAKAKSNAVVKIFVEDDLVGTGAISVKGSAAALRWLRY